MPSCKDNAGKKLPVTVAVEPLEASQRYQAALGRVLCVSQHSQVPAANLP